MKRRYQPRMDYVRHCASIFEKLKCRVTYKRNGGIVVDPPYDPEVEERNQRKKEARMLRRIEKLKEGGCHAVSEALVTRG